MKPGVTRLQFKNTRNSYLTSQVKLIVIQSVLDTIYHMLNYSDTVPCLLPRPACVKSIETIASSFIQMLRILAKVVLSRLSPYLTCVNKQCLILDTVEMQSFLNYLQSQPTYNEVTTYPICHYMKDVLALDENRVAFLKWNAPSLIVAVQKKHTDPCILELFDQLVSMLITPAVMIPVQRNMEIAIQSDDSVLAEPELECAEDSDCSTEISLCPFDLVVCTMKHFLLFAKEVSSASTSLTKFTLNGLTILLGFIRDMMTLGQDLRDKIVDLFSSNTVYLSSLFDLVDRWHGMYVYRVLMVCMYVQYVSYSSVVLYIEIIKVWDSCAKISPQSQLNM